VYSGSMKVAHVLALGITLAMIGFVFAANFVILKLMGRRKK